MAISLLLLCQTAPTPAGEQHLHQKKQQKQSCALSWCIVSPATNVFNVWGCQDVWVTGAQTMSMESYCPRFLQWETVDLLCIMGFVHHPLNFVTSPVRRANC